MPATESKRQFFRDGDGRIREVLDVAKCLAQRSGRYVSIKPSLTDIGPRPSAGR